MAKPFDAASKHIVDFYPGDWLALGGLPPGTTIEITDADLSAVSTAADKLIRVSGPKPYVAHIEFQSSADEEQDERVLVYHVLARRRLKLPVFSVVFLLRPEAMTAAIKGRISAKSGADHRLEFRYKLVPVWKIKPKMLLKGGIGTLPLAPISAVAKGEVPGVIAAMKRRLDREVPPEEAREVWAATQILMGLRYSNEVVKQMMRGVQDMEESTTYQAIMEKGVEKGIEKGIAKGIEKGRILEARAVLLRRGNKQLGPPPAKIKARLEKITDVHHLEELTDQLLDGAAKDWAGLLKLVR